MVVTPRASFTSGMSVGTQPPVRRVGWFTRGARLAGIETAWVVDHYLGFFPQQIWDKQLSWFADPGSTPHAFFEFQTLLGHLASRVGGMRVGVGVTEPTRRHPVELAQGAMTLAHLTKRTPILGIGAGEAENIVPYGLDFSTPVSRLEEALEVIRLCFVSEGPFDFAGRHFRLEKALMDLRPPPGRTPELWVAAHGPRMLRLTGKYGDGWYPTLTMTAAEYESSLAMIQQAASEAGREPAAITPGWQTYAIVGRSEKDARRHLETRAIRFMALLAPAILWRKYGYTHPLGEDHRGLVDFVPQHHTRAELQAAIDAVPTEFFAEEAFIGTPESIERQIAEYFDAGLRHLVLQPISALTSRRDALYSMWSTIAIQRRLRRRFRVRA